MAVGLITQVGDAIDLLGAHEVRDLFDERRLVRLIRQLRDDDLVAVALRCLLDVDARTDDDAALSVGVGGADGVPLLRRWPFTVHARNPVRLEAKGDAAGGEVRPRDYVRQVSAGRLRIVDQADDGVTEFGQVVGRDVRRHSDGDAGGAVGEQVGQTCRQRQRLLERAIEVLEQVDGVLVEVDEELHRDRAQPRLRVAHGGRRVVVHRAEVALAVDERIAQRERLGEANHRLIHRTIAVRVVLAEHLTDDTGALLVGRRRC